MSNSVNLDLAISALRKSWGDWCVEYIALEERLRLARNALADISHSSDMTLAIARKKAKRIYDETRIQT